MTIESNEHILDLIDIREPTQKLGGGVREKYLQKWRYKAKQSILQSTPSGTYHLSVVVAIGNEQENIKPLLEALQKALDSLYVEVIFVDDSSDTTPEVIECAARTMSSPLFQIHLEHCPAEDARTGGLGAAIVHGLHKAQAEHIAVIQAGHQHHVWQLPTLYDQAVAQNVDLIVANYASKSSKRRRGTGRGISVYLKWLARLLFPGKLWRLPDPWSDFFLLRRELLADVALHPISHNILLELLIRCQWSQVLEMQYATQADGQHEMSAQQSRQTWQHMQHLWREVPAAGRILKIGLLLLLNFLLLLALLVVDRSFPWLLSNFSMPVFVVIAGLDFVIFNQLIFPSPIVSGAIPPVFSIENEESEAITALLEGGTIPSVSSGENEESEAITALLEGGATSSVFSGENEESEAITALLEGGATSSVFSIENEESETITALVQREAEVAPKQKLRPGRRRFGRFLPAIKSPVKRKTRGAEVDAKQESRPRRKTSDSFVSVVAVVLISAATGWIGYMRPGAPLVLALLFIGAAIVFANNVKREHAITMLLALATAVATVDYISWRFVVTNWHGWWLAVPLLFAETLGALHGLGFQLTVWPWSPPKVGKKTDPTLHPIFIFIPTVNEGVAILRPTLEGIITARDKYLACYPAGQVTIVLCNDGRVAKAANWEEAEALAQELGVCCVTRTIGGGAKAGNIENARQVLEATGDALLVIFDADQVAKPDFLLKTIPPFCDPKMGWVQTGQYYANLDNPVSRWADDQQSMFYNLLCPGKAALNAAFICGTNVVIRAAALDQIGGLPQNSVTEDFAASIALHPSWRSVYLTDVLATGLGPLDVPSYLKQQSRWAIGTLGVLRSHWRNIFLPRKNGLRIGQRIQYFLACTHYLCGLRDLIYLISPILFIFTGIPAVAGTTIGDYIWHFLPYALVSFISLWYSVRDITGLRGIIIGFGSFPVLIGSLLSVILQRKVGFAVTSKQRGGKRSPGYLSVYLVAVLLCILSLVRAALATDQQQVSLFVSVLWVVYSMLLLGSFLLLHFKDMRFQALMESAKTSNETMADQPYPIKLAKRRRGLNPLWNLGLAVLLAVPILAHESLNAMMSFMDPQSTPFVLTADKAPGFGVSVPIELLNGRPRALERVLGTRFSIVGRTQDIHDRFDTSWANQLAAEQTRPWVTLQFGALGCRIDCPPIPASQLRTLPPLDANLPAIVNGVDDQELKRWAEDIRNYNKPVYMTVLLHVDKNWSLSSGVANGGIPQDVPRAWMHVQSVFRAVGAKNVAWVWAPADPTHDQVYAPPLASIDAVLQDFIDYSGDKWGDPVTVLHDLAAHYPTKPIIVEASVQANADGSSARKVAWLTQLGEAVDATAHVHALLYHEGGPALKLTADEDERWSLSDLDSLAVMRHIVSVLHQKATQH